MGTRFHVVMSDPEHYEVCYTINPWMQPAAWTWNAVEFKRRSRAAWSLLARKLETAGAMLEIILPERDMPDLVFPSNGAIVLNGRALLGRFRHEERRKEEKCYKPFFDHLWRRGVITEWHSLPDMFYQEGAGDCIWDIQRNLFWAGYGPRSSAGALDYIQAYFGQDVIGLELTTAHYYHLDTCFCPLPGGEVMYYPGAFSPTSLALIEEYVPAHQRIVATAEEAATFCLNTFAFQHDLFMAPPSLRIRSMLMERGYRVHEVDVSSFMLSGGGTYCMTLRLDLCSQTVRRLAA